MRHIHTYMRVALISIAIGMMVACASIGRPGGGPIDTEPPLFISSSPTPGALNVTDNKIEILFNENVMLEDASNKVVVSPAQKNMPSISANGKKVIVELRDTLQPNTTYTIDFSDAIRDLNERNVLDGYAIDFSTGETIDSLRLSGMVLEARTLEPAQGMLVGIYSNLSDSAIITQPFDRIAKTNQLGQFTIRGLKPGEYHIFALKDNNRDLHWDRSEDIAFYDKPLSPTTAEIEVTDTLRATNGADSLTTRKGVKYLPNNILLTWFNEGYSAQYLKDYKRPERRRLTFQFAAKADTLPQISIINGAKAGTSIDKWALLNTGETLDTLEYWISDKEIIAQDSILVEAKYLRTDTNDQLSWSTDTLRLFYKDRIPKKKKKDEENDTTPQLSFINWSIRACNPQEVNKPLIFSTSHPISHIDSMGVRLSIKRDSVWEILPNTHIIPDSARQILSYSMPYKWEPGMKYRLEIDSAAIVSIYNEWNRPIKQEFSVRATEEYANLFFNISETTQPIIVELLNGSDKIVATSQVIDGIATFNYLLPGTYYARAFIDKNKNGIYDTGKLNAKQQPEEVYYYPKRINVKKNWDIEQSWNIYEQALDLQKPIEIKKNKPAKKKTDKDSGDMDEDEVDEFDEEYYNPGRNQNNSNSNNRKIPSGLRRAPGAY